MGQELLAALSKPMTTVDVLAETLGVSYKAALGMVKRNEIANVKVGSMYRVQTGPIRRMIGLEPSRSEAA